MAIHSEAPYYDDYDRAKGFTQVLALPGRYEQAREFTQAQTILRDYIERLGSAVFKDGYIVSGCTLYIEGTTATVQAGQVFLDGLVRDVAETSVQVTNAGIENIMVRVVTSIITELEDASLRDPAQESENYGTEGAYREKQVVAFSVLAGSDTSSAVGSVLYTLNNGNIVNNTDNSEYSVFSDLLAERTYDENGNFKISGLFLQNQCIKNETTQMINAYVSSGKAYVHGYEVNKSTTSSLPLNVSNTTRTVSGESHVYSSTLNKYKISNNPVSAVSNITCAVQVSETSKTRGSVAGGYDALLYTPVKDILTISQGATTYTNNVDYKLYADQVDWSLNGIEPVIGSSYSVTYVYNKTMIEGTDYEIQNDSDASYVVFLQDGDKPTENSVFYIYYTYTLARRDLILLDSSGNLSAIQGIPDRLNKLLTPYNMDREKLELGYVDIYPTFAEQNTVAVVSNYQSVRLTQANMYSMLKRIDNIELNMAELDLERAAESTEAASDLIGIYTDGFTGITKCDLYYNKTINGTPVTFDCCIDYDLNEMTTPAGVSDYLVEIDNNSSVKGVIGNVISAPFEYVQALAQPYATGTMLVNPYAAYDPLSAVKLVPSTDNWVDKESVTVYDTAEETSYTTTYATYSHGYWSTHATKNLRGFMGTSTSTTVTEGQSTASLSTKTSVAESVSEYIRVRDVEVIGKSFKAGLTNIVCTFNGIVCPLTATGTTVQLTGGKIQAGLKGDFTATFTIPANVPCGAIEVKLSGSDGTNTFTGTAIYTAEGTILTTTITNTTTLTRNYNVLVATHNLYRNDPLAQSFIFSADTTIGKLGLYFATKDSDRPAVVQVRNVVNGYPGEIVYAETILDPANVNVPASVDADLVVTNVEFNQPVYCYADTYYCFIILSDSNEYSMFYAGLGETMWNNIGNYMTVNPYTSGVLFSSSNASTWTAHQGSDLKFDIYKLHYTGVGEIVFNDVDIDSSVIDGLLLDAAYEDNKNAGLTWYYRLTSGGTWLPLDSLVFRDLQATTNTVSLKATISIAYNTSPFIAADRVSLKCFADKATGTYISKSLSDVDEYQALKISYQVALPSGASCDVYYQDIENGNWNKVELNGAVVDGEGNPIVTLTTKSVSEEFVQYTWNISKIKSMIDDNTKTGSTYYKVRIDLSTPIIYNRPRVKELISIMKYSL